MHENSIQYIETLRTIAYYTQIIGICNIYVDVCILCQIYCKIQI